MPAKRRILVKLRRLLKSLRRATTLFVHSAFKNPWWRVCVFLLAPAAAFTIYLIQKQPVEVADLNHVVNDANSAQIEIAQFQAHLNTWNSLFRELQTRADAKDNYQSASAYLDNSYSDITSFRTHLESIQFYSPDMSRLSPYSERMKLEADRLIKLSNPFGGPLFGELTNFKAGEFEDLLKEHSTFFKTVGPQLDEVVQRNRTQVNDARSRRISLDIESWIGNVSAIYAFILCPVFVLIGIARKWNEVEVPTNAKTGETKLERGLETEQLTVIQFLYDEDRLCTFEELKAAAGIKHNQDAILLISSLCDDTGHLRRIRGRQGTSSKSWVTGEWRISPTIPTKYGLTNKGRELARARNYGRSDVT